MKLVIACHVALAGIFGTAATAEAQSKPAKKPAPAKPAATAPAATKPATEATPRESPTFEKLHVAAEELPKEWKFETEPAFVSPQPATLIDEQMAAMLADVLPAPKRKDVQTIAGPAGRGSILYLEYDGAIPAETMEFVTSLLWGDGAGPSRAHPEELVRAGSVLMIVSFPPGCATGAWVLDRMRRRFGARVRHDFGELRPQIDEVMRAYKAEDHVAGRALLQGTAATLAATSFGAYLDGELCVMAKDWEGAEKAYARALELDATSDPFPNDGICFASLDGLGTALWGLAKWDDGAKQLRKAADFAAALARDEDQGHSLYNCACCLAKGGHADEAIKTLAQSIELAPEGAALAKQDEDFASLQKRPDFQKLVQ